MGSVAHRGFMAPVFAAVLFASMPTSVFASPDFPMCVAGASHLEAPPITLVRWHAPMCGPYLDALTFKHATPPKARAVEAYRMAVEHIAAADYDEARLQLDLAYEGLPRISDRIALKSGRLELLRRRPERAAEFFAEAANSPHESVRVEAHLGRVFALLRADDPGAEQALHELLSVYPSIPNRSELSFEQAQSLLRRGRQEEAIAVMHSIRVDHPGSRVAPWAESELKRLRALGYETPSMTNEDRVRQARHLVRTGPLDEAKTTIAELLQDPLTGDQHAVVHYLAGRLARDEGRWEAAESFMRAAQSYPTDDPVIARHLAQRASELAQTAAARKPELAERELAALRAGRVNASIPSKRLANMVRIAAAAGLREEVDGMLTALRTRTGAPSALLFDATMAAIGTGSEELVIALLEQIAKRAGSSHRVAAIYHLARAHERAERPAAAALFFTQAKAAAELAADPYYALWAQSGLARVAQGRRPASQEVSSGTTQRAPRPPRVSDRVLAQRLQRIGEQHEESFPWISRAADLLRISEREAATGELFEAYLTWRDALGRPIASAGLTSVARADGRIREPVASDVRAARLGLSDEDRATLSAVAAALGDMGTAAGFAGPDFVETRPRAYEWLVVPAADRYGLDPNLLLAVMRVESVYQKHIVSYAGAVGLMQIMPRTGQLIAHALGHHDFSAADLLDPRLNLEFAAWYLTSLIRRFDGRIPLAIAAYNGGPHNVRRWIQESAESTPVDVLLEKIPFSQTHRYVRKVLVHYEAYRKQRDLPMPQLPVEPPAQRVDPIAF